MKFQNKETTVIALIQRVSEAAVRVDGEVVGEIEQGLLVLLGVEKGDDEAKAKRLMERVTTYRVFEDEDGKMNLNVKQVEGKVLVVSQFTLPAARLWMVNNHVVRLVVIQLQPYFAKRATTIK